MVDNRAKPAGPGGADATALIRDYALRLGFEAVGFAPARLGVEARLRLKHFIQSGHHGEMSWLAERVEQRASPDALWPEAVTAIVLGLSYAPDGDALETLKQPNAGNISVYARHRDYHDIIKGKLKHLAQFILNRLGGGIKVFVDTAPIMEKPLAQSAGLGWQGKHTNLVSRAHGSWLLLGEILTTLDLPASPASGGSCGSCVKCLQICPTDAFPAPYQLDARRCISYLTIEHKGPIPLELRPLMGNRIYGCDDCLAVCPWNKFARPTTEAKFFPRDDLRAPSLARLAVLDEAAFRALFAGSPVKRIGRDRFVRNVLNAIGNSDDETLSAVASGLCSDPSPIVADSANWAVARLGHTVPQAATAET